MRLTRGSNLRLLAVLAAPIVLAASACPPDAPSGPNAAVGGVGLTLGPPGAVSDVILTLGDRDTIRAQAYTSGWPTYTKYDSQSEPRRFAYSSSDPHVATVDADGVVVTMGLGTTQLRATSEGVTGLPMALTVVPPARELRVTPTAFEAAVGDMLTVTVTAVDESGADVAGVVFNVSTDTTVWAVVSPPIEGDWRLATPRVLHIPASRPGSVRLLARSQNERAAARLESDSVRITVRTP